MYRVALVLGVILAGCASASAQVDAATDLGACDSQICELTKTLASLNLENPIADLDRNLGVGNRSFVGISGYSCYAPGTDKAPEPQSERFGTKCLRGTSDVVEGDVHLALIDKATSYARAYNVELLRRIRAGLIS